MKIERKPKFKIGQQVRNIETNLVGIIESLTTEAPKYGWPGVWYKVSWTNEVIPMSNTSINLNQKMTV